MQQTRRSLALMLAATQLAISNLTAAAAPFNGVGSSIGNLYRLSDAKSRSICPENFTGEKGKAAMATTNGSAWHAARDLGQGWKVSPYVRIPAKQTFTLAEIDGPGAIQHI
jgi:hypothetical protein